MVLHSRNYFYKGGILCLQKSKCLFDADVLITFGERSQKIQVAFKILSGLIITPLSLDQYLYADDYTTSCRSKFPLLLPNHLYVFVGREQEALAHVIAF